MQTHCRLAPLLCFLRAAMSRVPGSALVAAEGVPAKASVEQQGNRPLIRKLGTIDLDLVETTPVVFKGRLYRFEWVREGYWNNQRKTNYFRFVDHETGEASPSFADGHEFGSAFVNGNTVYVTGTQARGGVNVFT